MVKFENRVAQAKISRYIETSQLVIFLNDKCIDESSQKQAKNYFHKKLTKSLAESYKYNITRHKIFSNLSLKEYVDLQSKTLQIRTVKNSYVKKALLKKSLFNCNHSTLALTQGNHLVIAFQPTTFFLLKDLKQDKNISILGAIYNNCSIDQNQISQLSKIIEEDQIYHNLNNTLKNNVFSLISLINGASSTRCNYTRLSENVYAKLCLTMACLQKKLDKENH